MPFFKTELQDVYFNLFNLLNVAEHAAEMEESDLKEVIREYDKFVENEIFPTRMESDKEGCSLKNGQVKAPQCLKSPNKKYYENGWFALGFPEEIGGMPMPEAVTVACQSIGISANMAWYMYPGLTHAALNVIIKKGSDEQKKMFVDSMMSGEWGGTMCLTEAGAGSDVGALRTMATPNGDGTYKINGVKMFISSGDNDLYSNLIHLVLARTPNAPKGTKGISLFIVPKFKIGADGELAGSNDVVCTKIEEKMGIHANATCELNFGGNDNCTGYMIGNEFEGMESMFIMMNEARLHCGLQGEAQANLCSMISQQYAKERVQFGTEIVNFPDVKRNLLKMRAVSRGMRALCLYTANMFDLAKKDSSCEGLTALLTPICKAYCTDMGFQVAVDSVQVHGGYGYCTEYGVEQFVRDIKIASIYEGTNGIQAMDYVTRKILKDQGVSLQKLTGTMMATLARVGQNFPKEKVLMEKVLGSAKQIMDHISKYAQAKNFDGILQHSVDFLNFSGNMVVGWLLLDSALLAKERMDGATDEEKVYLNSKIVDFQIFCAHYLIHNLSLAKTITEYEQDLASIEI